MATVLSTKGSFSDGAFKTPGSPSSRDSSTEYPIEKTANNDTVYDEDLRVPSLEHTTEAALYRKIDVRVLPALCLMFLMAFLDKVNISNAEVYGLSDDIGLDKDNTQGTQFNQCLVIFYVPYIILEIPSNIFLKKLTPHIWLSVCMFLFGIATMTQGFVTNYGGLMTARFFLGVFETPVFPGAYYIISMWYKRHESQRRFTFFYASISLAGAFGGLLAAAIGKMDGVRGLQGWRWIFIIEGLATALIAIALFFLLPDFPETAKWVTPAERAYVRARLTADQGASAHDRRITGRDVVAVFHDWKVWIAGFMYMAILTPGYSYAYFAPTIIRNFNFSPIKTQLWSVPPWACTFAWCMLLATSSDFVRRRFIFVIGSLCLTIVGTAVLLSRVGSVHLQYGMLFLFVMGCYGATPIMTCWFAMNLGGHHRRSVGSAWQIAMGQVGGIIAVFTFLKRDQAGGYIPGYSICLAFALLAMLLAAVYCWGCWAENRHRDRAAAERETVLSKDEREEMGDLAPDYRYML